MGLTDIHRAAGDAALFDTAVIYESYPVDTSGVGGDVDIAGMRLMGVESAAASHFPLSIVAAPVDGRLHLAAEFQHEAFDEATVAGHLDRPTIRVLREFVARPEANVGSLRLITDDELQLLDSYNRTELHPRDVARTHRRTGRRGRVRDRRGGIGHERHGAASSTVAPTGWRMS